MLSFANEYLREGATHQGSSYEDEPDVSSDPHQHVFATNC